ncbi:MAG: Protein translocase subunit SecF [uncultured Rubrobacteraceae bacterium]|uniref:Protein-export membrane protein SecF n=1 Tax=uncultured Rubrobacteraceae bacterium TaxID=349277 RepID=A0A6J4RWZ3_9ACTN|nr:MAG: Protein translocase subunit SecF [uncultured Rubrobacteraceae bacterium]
MSAGVFSKVDFVGRWRLWFAISGVFLLICVVAIALGRLNFGIDFEGGSKFTLSGIDGNATTEEVREALPGDLGDDAVVTSVGENGYEVRTPVLDGGQDREVRDTLAESLGAEVSVTSISPTFGGQIRAQALQAVAAALIIIVLFISIRFAFAFAIAAMLALLHDILITVGFYALVGREVNLVTVVAVLTVLGYSLYDTIIIFDRIRENTPEAGYNRRRFDQMANASIRQVVMRSIYTSVCTLIPVAALLIFGESTLSDFAFALFVGIAAGTYSSIFIAAPVLALYKAWQANRASKNVADPA